MMSLPSFAEYKIVDKGYVVEEKSVLCTMQDSTDTLAIIEFNKEKAALWQNAFIEIKEENTRIVKELNIQIQDLILASKEDQEQAKNDAIKRINESYQKGYSKGFNDGLLVGAGGMVILFGIVSIF